MPDYKMVKANAVGRDFVVGDVHGMFDRVQDALAKVNFERDRDRLFCVGDLIDRGPQSREVVHFLDQPFVHAVCGNHEDALLQMHAGSAQPNSEIWLDGADWWRELSKADRRAVVARLKRLPLVIEVPTPRGNVAFLHADVPRGMNWSDFRVALKTEPERIRHTVLWGRGRIGREDDAGVAGIGRVFVGHTVQPDGLRRYGNVYAIDTGAVFGWKGMHGRLTCVDIQSSTAGLDELHRVGKFEVDALDLPAPDRPFGPYAKPQPDFAEGE
jgi:serine/threonine protein phosphatase 1